MEDPTHLVRRGARRVGRNGPAVAGPGRAAPSAREGTLFVSGNVGSASLILDQGMVTFDTSTGYFAIENGGHGEGIFSSHSYVADESKPT